MEIKGILKVADAENLLPMGPWKDWKAEQWEGGLGVGADSYKDERKLKDLGW